jgi:hypothetical protein
MGSETIDSPKRRKILGTRMGNIKETRVVLMKINNKLSL